MNRDEVIVKDSLWIKKDGSEVVQVTTVRPAHVFFSPKKKQKNTSEQMFPHKKFLEEYEAAAL